MTQQARWQCPHCQHGCLAPTKPRRDDVRRYCLDCSRKTGRLVERVAPALERKREARKQAAGERAKVARARTRERMRPVKDRAKRYRERQAAFDKEADRLWPIFEKVTRELAGRYVGSRPPVRLTYTNRFATSGLWDGHTVTVRIQDASTGSPSAWETLAHELCHAALGSHHYGEASHGRLFYKVLREVAQRRWRLPISFAEINGTTDSSHSWGYKVDHIIIKQIGHAVTFTYPSVKV